MYRPHFGLHEAPFSITPDPDFVYIDMQHQVALDTLMLALEGGEGFVKVTGEVGTGKTLLCRRLMAALPASVVTAYIFNPRLEAGRSIYGPPMRVEAIASACSKAIRRSPRACRRSWFPT